jgi:hypothetical protein
MLRRLLIGLAMALTAPVLGMLLAAEVYVRRHGLHQVICAKLHHHNNKRCIFRHCGYHADRDRPLAAER